MLSQNNTEWVLNFCIYNCIAVWRGGGGNSRMIRTQMFKHINMNMNRRIRSFSILRLTYLKGKNLEMQSYLARSLANDGELPDVHCQQENSGAQLNPKRDSSVVTAIQKVISKLKSLAPSASKQI